MPRRRVIASRFSPGFRCGICRSRRAIFRRSASVVGRSCSSTASAMECNCRMRSRSSGASSVPSAAAHRRSTSSAAFLSTVDTVLTVLLDVARMAEALEVRIVLGPTVFQRRDVIDLGRCANAPRRLTAPAERITTKDPCVALEQATTADSLRLAFLGRPLVLGAATAAAHERRAAWMRARSGRGVRHQCA